jgi:hypothetical protein
VGLALAVAFALAVVWAAISDKGLAHSLRTTCLALGCIALLMGGIGRGSNFERSMDADRHLGRIPGLSSLQSRGEDPTLAPGIVFFLTGAALLALALLVF